VDPLPPEISFAPVTEEELAVHFPLALDEAGAGVEPHSAEEVAAEEAAAAEESAEVVAAAAVESAEEEAAAVESAEVEETWTLVVGPWDSAAGSS